MLLRLGLFWGVAQVGLRQAPGMAHHFGHFLDLFDGEGRVGQRPHGDGHQLHRVVVCGDAVGGDPSAHAAPVDDGPFSVLANPYGDGLHLSAAVCLAIARLNVQVEAGQAVGTVVAVIAARPFRDAQPSAAFAGEALIAGIVLVLVLVVLLALVFAVHVCLFLSKFIQYTG